MLRKMPSFGRFLGTALQRVEDGINNLGLFSGIDASGVSPTPPPIQGLTVASDGAGLAHVVINHSAPTQKNFRYFVEWGTDPSFNGAYQEDLGAARHRVLSLPQGTYFFRAFHQLPNSQPSKPVNFGGNSPTGVVMSSGSTLSLLPSTGSGTGAGNGSQPGVGIGKTFYRPAPGPKRTSGKTL
jgi:hypothetical protein